MGFGTIAANMIMFIAIVTLATGLLFVMNVYVQETQSSIQQQKNQIIEEIRTDITIEEISYNSENDELLIYVRNTGKIELSIERTEVYIDGLRVSNSQKNNTLEEDTIVSNNRSWSPREILKIEADIELTEGRKRVRVATHNGISDEVRLDVE